MTAPKSGEERCIFCDAASDRDARARLTLHADDRIVVLLNRYPYTNGHLMVAPVAHVAHLYETDPATLSLLIRATAETQRILADHYRPDGFNIGMNFGRAAGAGVADHYHVHVVPRWSGDANFMTVTGQTRMIPEELEGTWERLRPKFETFGKAFS